MPTLPERRVAFEQGVLFPAWREIAASPRLSADYEVAIVERGPAADPVVNGLLAALGGAIRRVAGPGLVVSARQRPADAPAEAGRYVSITFYDIVDEEVVASPGVLCWMRFNRRLHGFDHRYDAAIARHRVEDLTREHVQNHFLGAFDFFKLYADRPTPFPGYGR